MADTHIKIKPVVPRVQYVGNGVTTDFAYSFAIFDETDMEVYIGNTKIDPDATVIIGEGDDAVEYPVYTITGVGEEDGGEVVFTVAPENDAIITLVRNVPVERMTDFQEGGTFRPKNLNDELDRQTAFCQQIEEALNRCVKVDVTSQIEPSAILPQVERLYESVDNIDTVSEHVDEIDTVSNNMTDVSNCSSNMAAIQDAPTQASNAASSADAAALSAAQAAISAAGTHFKLFHHGWFDYELNDMAWLRADTYSWQDGTVYSNAYNHLVADIDGKTASTETVNGTTVTYYLADDGHKIVKVADVSAIETVYSSTGVAWYYVLDTANQRFKLPRTKYGFTGLRDTVGKYVSESLPNIKGTSNYAATTNSSFPVGAPFYNATPIGSTLHWAAGSEPLALGIDASLSSPTYKDNAPVQQRATQMYLYFYVGQFSQSATEQTAGLNSELFNGKLDLDLGNASNTTKETIVGWGIPDYSAGLSKSWNTDNTAETNGYVIAHDSSGGSSRLKAIVNSCTLPFDDIANYGRMTICFFVAKGDIWKVYGGDNDGRNVTFYPLKGSAND